MGIGKSTVNDYLSILLPLQHRGTLPKILIFDIETSPEISYHFGRWKVNITEDKVIQRPYMMTWAAKWLGQPEIVSRKLPDYVELYKQDPRNDRALVEDLLALINEADMVVAHNGDKFDVSWLRSRILFHNQPPLAPNRFYDTLKVSKKLLNVPSHSLKSLCKYFGLVDKLDNDGFVLWRKCDEGDTQAWIDMETYNVGDIDSLEALYLILRSHDPQHPNLSLLGDNNALECHVCGSKDIDEIDKRYYTQVSEFKLYRCGDCGAHQRKRTSEKTREQRTNILMPR